MPTFNSIAQLVSYIDTNINTNGVDSISGAELNTALNGIVSLMQEHTIIVELDMNTNTLVIPALLNAFNVKVFAGGRLIDNSINSTSYPDGYTFNSSTNTITFASVRGAGEVFTIDYFGGS